MVQTGEMNMGRWWNCTDGRNEYGALEECYRRGKLVWSVDGMVQKGEMSMERR